MKGKVSAFKLKYLFFVFIAVAAVSLPLRVYQLIKLVEPATGFYASVDVTVWVLYGLCAVFCIACILGSYLSAQVPSPKLPTGKNKLLGVASVLFALGLLWSVVDSLVSLISVFTGKSAVISSEGFMAFLQDQGGVVTMIRILVAFLGAIYLLVFCVSHFNGKASYREQRVLALMPLGWAMCSLVTRLTQAIGYVKVSELFLEMCMYVFLMLFLMTFARVSSGVAEKGTMWEIYGFGLPAALFALLVSVPRFVVMILGKESVASHPFDIADVSVALFVIMYIFASLGVGYYDVKAVEPEESEEWPEDSEESEELPSSVVEHEVNMPNAEADDALSEDGEN